MKNKSFNNKVKNNLINIKSSFKKMQNFGNQSLN